MTRSPHPTHLAGACAALALSVALAHHAPPSHACTTINVPQPSRADVIWPPSGNGARDIPVRTHIWLSYSGPHTLQLTQTDTGIEIPLTALETRTSQVGIGMHPGTYIVRLVPARVLEPETSYTLRLTLNGSTLTQTFSTARSDAPLPSLTHTARPRVYRRHLNRLTHDGGDCYSDPQYNTARYAELEQPHITHPVLYVLDSDKDSADDAHLAQQFGRDFIIYHPTQPHRYIILKRNEADPYDDPCLTLRWVDVFGREGALDPICAPDACTAPGHDPGGWPFPDFRFYTPELCDPEPTQDDNAPQSNAQDDEDEGVGCATALHHPSPTLLPLALIALGAWCLRRGRTTP